MSDTREIDRLLARLEQLEAAVGVGQPVRCKACRDGKVYNWAGRDDWTTTCMSCGGTGWLQRESRR